MVKSCDSTLALEALAIALVFKCSAGSIKDMKAQGSRNGKALGISELLASVYSASALLDRPWI